MFGELYVYAGQTAYFKCLSSSGTGVGGASGTGGGTEKGTVSQHTVQWYKDEAPLRWDETRMTLFSSGSLEIDLVSERDRGHYQCNITSGTISK